jgi:SM-20-related protein
MPRISKQDIDSLSTEGYVIIPNFLPQDLVDELRDDILQLRSGGAFREAKIGQDSTNSLNRSIRIAETCFIGRNRPELTRITGSDSVRDRSNGLYDILDGLCDSLVDLCWKESEAKLDKSLTELLYAYYPTGGFYRRHRDAIPNSASVLRKYSLLLYLNRQGWSPETDAGQLRIHLDGGGDEIPVGVEPKFIDVDPSGGTLVLFKSELIPHEVLDTMSERFALVGWYNRGVTASDIGNLGDGGGGDIARVGMLAVALLLVTFGVASIIGQ